MSTIAVVVVCGTAVVLSLVWLDVQRRRLVLKYLMSKRVIDDRD
jgi:hypothetical protein